jgi:hypothetical protein
MSDCVALGPQAWDAHLDLLRASYPAWAFDTGYGTADPGG